jgi:hypothetical protein
MLLGIVIGLLFSDHLYRRGCKLKVSFAPPGIDTDCSGTNYEVTLTFGQSPPTLTFRDALHQIADITGSKGSARVTIDPAVLSSKFATARVQPPAGPESSIAVLHQLIDQAGATGNVLVCILPAGGIGIRFVP